MPVASWKKPISQSGGNRSVHRTTEVTSGIDNVILNSIEEDPFYTIAELKVVIEESLLGIKISWWSVFKILRRMKLLSRRSRFRYARKTRKGR